MLSYIDIIYANTLLTQLYATNTAGSNTSRIYEKGYHEKKLLLHCNTDRLVLGSM